MARRSYNRAFKEEAVRLGEKSGATQAAADLGIHPNMIHSWKRQLAGNAEKAFPGNGNPTDPVQAWYNRQRKHSGLQYLSPSEYESGN